MSPESQNRRKDHVLRKAIDNIHAKLPELDSHFKVYRQTLHELCRISHSSFAFVLEDAKQKGEQSVLRCIAAVAWESDSQLGNKDDTDENGENYKGKDTTDQISDSPIDGHIISENDCHSLFAVLTFQRALVADSSALRCLRTFNVKWPRLEQVLAIPLIDGKQTKRILLLANAPDPYHVEFSRRVWPLLTTCISLIRIVEHRELKTSVEKRLLIAQDTWRESFDKIERLVPVGMITLTSDERILRINPTAETIFGVKASHAVNKDISEFFLQSSPRRYSSFRHVKARLEKTQPSISVQGRRASGELVPLNLSVIQFGEYQQPRTLLIVQDGTDLQLANQRHQNELQRFRALADLAPSGILQTNAQWFTEYANDRWHEITGMTPDKMQGLDWSKMLFHEDAEIVLEKLHSSISCGKELRGEWRIKKGEDVIWVCLHAAPLFAETGDVTGFLATLTDNSEHHASQDRLRQLAERDTLTGLANRTLFFDRLEQALTRIQRHGAAALLALDLDGFKNINDTLGHDIGDAMLIEVGRRLVHCVRNEDTVARVGGDEFFILLEGLHDATTAATISEKILTSLTMPFTVAHQEIFISTSIGISFAVAGLSSSVKSLLKQSDLALYRAKDAGRNNFQYYSPELELASRKKLELGNSLHRALGRAEFEVFYQTQAKVSSNQINGFEALLRWQHPEKGLLPPTDFISLLEETGLITPVSRWLYHICFTQMRKWIDDELVDKDATMAVNISPRQFRDAAFVNSLECAMKDAKLNGANVIIEITETVLIQEQGPVLECLKKIRALGVRVALDDFGTGYSSLSYLKKFPIDIIKIDRSFIGDLLVDKDDAAITQAVLVLAHSLELKVLAEGVEDEKILALLNEWSCDSYQGYLLNKPMSSQDMTQLLVECSPHQSAVFHLDPQAKNTLSSK